MRAFALLFALLAGFVGAARADDGNLIFLQPEFGYQAPRVFTQGQTASYNGFSYGGSVYYSIGDEEFSIAPFVDYQIGCYSNTANTASREEKLSQKSLVLGLKAYFGNLFVRAGYGFINSEDKTTGNLNQTISASGHGLNGGLGFVIPLSRYVRLEVSADVENVTYSANPQAFASQTQVLRMGGTLGLGVLLPSTPPRRSYFKGAAPAPAIR
ncbi:MAG: hypothetical protein JST04_14740 [Bdellovibrionales bacterium]|nr:hypothetical protein [Bdellovibrionales bacterium]